MKTLIFLVALVVICLSVTPAFAVNITGCQDLNQSGATYYLTQDIVTSQSSCLLVEPNVTLDCQGHIITGDGTNNEPIILYSNPPTQYYDATVRNCIVSNFTAYGVYLLGASNSTLYNDTIENSGTSLYLSYTDNSSISDVSVVNGNLGMLLTDSFYNLIDNVSLINDTQGLNDQSSADFNEIENSVIAGSGAGGGIYMAGVYETLLHDNLFNNTANINFIPVASQIWNSSSHGNYWGAPNKTGYSDTCDCEPSGLCSQPFDVRGDASVFDYLPLCDYVAPTSWNISSCGDANMSGLWNVTGDLSMDVNTSCLRVGADDVVINCQGHLINSTVQNGTAIAVGAYDDVTIENCIFAPIWVDNLTVNGFSHDISLMDSNVTVLKNNSFNSTITVMPVYLSGVDAYDFNGNYWGTMFHDGFSDLCSALNGVCTTPYDIFGNGSYFDYYPLSNNQLQYGQGGFGVLLTTLGQGFGGFLGGIQDPLFNFLILIGIVVSFVLLFFSAIAMAIRAGLKKA